MKNEQLQQSLYQQKMKSERLLQQLKILKECGNETIKNHETSIQGEWTEEYDIMNAIMELTNKD